MNSLEEFLKKTYYDVKNEAGFSSAEKLYQAARVKFPNVSRDQVKDFLSGQLTYTLHKPARKNFKRNPVVVSAVDEQWQADLADMTLLSAFNNGYKYILTVIDVLSKYAFAQPLKSKLPAEVISAFRKIFNERRPLSIQTDKGGEFNNLQFKNFLKTNNIQYFVSQNEKTKCQIVERFNRTLKTKLYKIFTYSNTKRYTDSLQTVVNTYNNTVHKSIKEKPKNVNIDNQGAIFNRLYKGKSLRDILKQRVAGKLKPGDQVRISKNKRTFEKGYLPNWTEEIFKIKKPLKKFTQPLAEIEDLRKNRIVGTFYPEEIQKIKTTAETAYRIEKVIKSRKKGRITEYFVKWLGYPEEFNSWVPASEFVK